MEQAIKNRIEQINVGQVPEGYAGFNTRCIPSDWAVVRLSDLFDRLNRKNDIENTNVLTISAQHGLINQEDFFNKEVASDVKTNYFLLEKGDFAYNKSYSSRYPFGTIKMLEKYEQGILSPLYICFSAKANTNTDFYKQYFDSQLYNHEIYRIAQEGARNHGLLNMSVEDFFNIILINPPLKEQQKIAEILGEWDKMIVIQEKILEKSYFMQQCILQNLFKNQLKWEFFYVRDIIEEQNIRNTDLNKRVLSVNNKRGFIEQQEQFSKKVASNDLREYKVVKKHFFAFNPSRINVGSIALNLGETGIVSPMYTVFSCKNMIDPHFFLFLFQLHDMKTQIRKALMGGVRETLSVSSFKNIQVKLPSLQEQKKITQICRHVDSKILLNERVLEKLKLQKKALMQLLLTGIVRVKV